MEQNEIRKLLQNVANGDISVDDALLHIKNEPFEDLGYAKPDFHRKMRQGVSEVIYGAGKTAEQIIGISKSFAKHGQKDILITRLDKTKAEKINKEIPLDYHDTANIGIIGSMPKERVGKIVIATGGTVIYLLRRKRQLQLKCLATILYVCMMSALPVSTDCLRIRKK